MFNDESPYYLQSLTIKKNKDNKTMELNIDIKLHGHAWANVVVDSESCLVGMYEDGKIARQLFLMDRESAAELAKILNAFANNQI